MLDDGERRTRGKEEEKEERRQRREDFYTLSCLMDSGSIKEAEDEEREREGGQVSTNCLHTKTKRRRRGGEPVHHVREETGRWKEKEDGRRRRL